MTRTPSPISKLRKLARQEPSLPDVMILARYVPTADDRAAAIIESTKLETELEDAIKSKMVSLNNTEHGEIFMGQGALATFGAKIKIAYANLTDKPLHVVVITGSDGTLIVTSIVRVGSNSFKSIGTSLNILL